MKSLAHVTSAPQQTTLRRSPKISVSKVDVLLLLRSLRIAQFLAFLWGVGARV
jgi:hypothetical protein